MALFALRVGGLICVSIWGHLAIFRGGFWMLRERLKSARQTFPGISVTAVIPARDEAQTIGITVRSLRAQSHPNLKITVADDESSDATSAIGASAGADLVVKVLPRPAGWKGKLWAVSEGIRGAGNAPDYYLLTDADIQYQAPGLLDALIEKARKGYDMVSVMVWLRCESPAEKFLIPAFVFFFFMLYPPGYVARKGGVAAAAGGCMLIRAEALAACGGIASIRHALIDDCALAQQVKATGGRLWLGVSDLPIRSIRAYRIAADIRAMISRSAFAQLRHSTSLLAGTVLGLLIAYVAPVLLLFSGDTISLALGAAAWIVSAILFLPTVSAYKAPRITVLCLPVIALFYLAATLESAWKYWTGKGGAWKGRVQDF